MIIPLAWDSELFGYKVGALKITPQQDMNQLSDKIKANHNYKLIYIYTSKKILSGNIPFPATLASENVTLENKIKNNLSIENSPYVASYKGDLNDNLLNIAMQSGLHSRFRTDKNFINNEYQKLYAEWIKRSIKREIASDVFVYSENNSVSGLITINEKNDMVEIGLLAVDENARGKSIGTHLINKVIDYTQNKGYENIRVATQGENVNAMNFYKKNNFVEINRVYIYHYWNL